MSSLGGKSGNFSNLPASAVCRVSLLVMAFLVCRLERMGAAAIMGHSRGGTGTSPLTARTVARLTLKVREIALTDRPSASSLYVSR